MQIVGEEDRVARASKLGGLSVLTCNRLRDLIGSPPSKTVNCVPIMLERSFPTKDSPARDKSVGSVVIR